MKTLLLVLSLFSFSAFAVDRESMMVSKSSLPLDIKVGKITVKRNIPRNLVMSVAPPADAFRGTLYGNEVAIFVNEIFPSQLYGYRTVVKSGTDWLYLDEPTFDTTQIDTKVKAYDMANIMINIINATAYDVLRTDGGGTNPEPESGVELMKWVLSNKLTVVSDELIIP